MDILANLKRSLELYGKNFVPVFLATLITALVSGITFGLLAGPLLGGLFVFLRKTIDGEKPELGEIFSRFDKFLPTFLVILITFLVGLVISVIGGIPVIGRLFSLAAGSLVSLISFMAIGYVIDKDLSPVDAINVVSKLSSPNHWRSGSIAWLFYHRWDWRPFFSSQSFSPCPSG